MKRLFIINHYLLMSFRTHDLKLFAKFRKYATYV